MPKTSKNPCPVCGGYEWQQYTCDTCEFNCKDSILLIDIEEVDNSLVAYYHSAISGCFDECLGCGTVIT